MSAGESASGRTRRCCGTRTRLPFGCWTTTWEIAAVEWQAATSTARRTIAPGRLEPLHPGPLKGEEGDLPPGPLKGEEGELSTTMNRVLMISFRPYPLVRKRP